MISSIKARLQASADRCPERLSYKGHWIISVSKELVFTTVSLSAQLRFRPNRDRERRWSLITHDKRVARLVAREADSVEIPPLLRRNFPNQAYGSEAAAVLVLGVLGLALLMTGQGLPRPHMPLITRGIP
jgi:hypothetical protein